MITKLHITHGFRAIAAILALALPMSVFAESRPSARTELEQMAAELARVFGSDAVRVERSGRSEQRSRTVSPDPREVYGTPVATTAEQALAAMNRERARQGLHPLRLNHRLNAAAADRAADMQRYGYFDHVSPTGRRPSDFVTAQGYAYRSVGENIAAGYRHGESVVGAWMRSPGHRANILGGYQEVGIASLGGSPVRGYSGDTWVALYASGR